MERNASSFGIGLYLRRSRGEQDGRRREEAKGVALEFENPQDLLRRLKLGREEYCQRLLTMLILEGPYPRWNSRSQPSAAGAEFLRALYERIFGGMWPGDDAVFVDEFELPPGNDAERGGAPD